MSEEAARKALAAAARKWVKASEARSRWVQEHMVFWWPESGESPPPEPKPVTREALDEYERLALAEQKAQEGFAKANRALLGGS